MERALLLVGKVETEEGSRESYQLLIGPNYIHTTYDGASDRRAFYDKTSNAFVERIIEESRPLELGIFNGLRINPETGSNERLQQLEKEIAAQLLDMVCSKLKRSPVMTISAASRN